MTTNDIRLDLTIPTIYALAEFDLLERVCLVSKKALEDELNILHGNMDLDMAIIGSEYEGDYLSHINDEYINISESMPLLQCYSQFLMSYSIFEKILNDLSKISKDGLNLQLSYKDISGAGISRSGKYFDKVVGIKKPFRTSEWNKARLANEVRNAISHGNGFIMFSETDEKSLYKKLSKETGFELKQEVANQEDARIVFGFEIVIDFIKIYRDILCDLADLPRGYQVPPHGLPMTEEERAGYQ